MIKLQKIRWKNFLSTGNQFTEIILDENIVTCIQGNNGNGKSTIIDAITFGLFNKPFRNINKNQLINSINKKECEVEIEFEIGTNSYKVRRGIKPNIFGIYLNGELINQDAALKDYQKYLEENILKLNYKSFTQIAILGKASYIPFMQLPAASRREVIEDLLDIKVFSLMNVVFKEEISEHKQNIAENDKKLEIASIKLDSQNKHILALEKNNADRIEFLNSSIDNLEKENLKLLEEATPINKETGSIRLVDITEIQKKLTKISNAKSEGLNRLSDKQKEIDFYENNQNCPTCKQIITDEFKQSEINSKKEYIEKIEQILKKVNADYEEQKQILSKILEENKEKEQKIDALKKQINDIHNKISTNNAFIESYTKELNSLNDSQGDLQKEIEEKLRIETFIENLEIEKNRLHNLSKHYDYILSILKDSGIKTKIIDKYIPIINKLVNSYLETMELFVEYELDKEFNEKIKSRHRDDFSYASFSEGEKARIDLAILLAFRSISKMKSTTNTNLLLLDEIFDGSIDADGGDSMSLILNSMSDTNVFVISHSEKMQEKIKNTITFKKINNYSVIV